MGDGPVDFANRFHNLEGDTIGERKKNFNKLLKDPSFCDKKIIRVALDNLEPKTYLESLFKVDALIHFRHTTKLLEVIKGGNDAFISKIVKQDWFYDEVFQTMPADVVVNEFLPCVSFVTRLKILKNLPKILNEEKIDAIFDAVSKRLVNFTVVIFN